MHHGIHPIKPGPPFPRGNLWRRGPNPPWDVNPNPGARPYPSAPIPSPDSQSSISTCTQWPSSRSSGSIIFHDWEIGTDVEKSSRSGDAEKTFGSHESDRASSRHDSPGRSRYEKQESPSVHQGHPSPYQTQETSSNSLQNFNNLPSSGHCSASSTSPTGPSDARNLDPDSVLYLIVRCPRCGKTYDDPRVHISSTMIVYNSCLECAPQL